MQTVDIPHGGSGEGITGWVQWGTGCLIASDLAAKNHRACTSGPLLIGTMTHEYLRMYRERSIAVNERVAFEDTICGQTPATEWQDEAYRLYCAYTQERDVEYHGKILGTEIHIAGSEVEAAVGVSPYTAQIDLLTQDPNSGQILMTDYKTARASGDSRYTSGPGLIQMHAYYFAAKAAGYDVSKIQIEQITKAKTPKINLYEIPLPSIADRKALQRFLGYASRRRAAGERAVLLTQCGHCEWRKLGMCQPGG